MRFRLVCPSNSNLFGLHVGDKVAAVRREFVNGEQRIAWRWWDGTEYALIPPQWPHGWMRIVSGEMILCCGQYLGWRWQTPLHDRATVSQWEFDGQTIVYEAGDLCCRMAPRAFTLWKQNDGNRLAFFRIEPGRPFRLGAAYRGVVRDGLPNELARVVFGIILSRVHVSLFMPTGD
jgi:hypothetical protein